MMRSSIAAAAVLVVACGKDAVGPSGPIVSSISVTPASDTIVVQGSAQLTAVARDSAGTPIPGLNFVWSSSAPAVASVDQSGNLVTATIGAATITAATAGKAGNAAIVVAPSVIITPQ